MEDKVGKPRKVKQKTEREEGKQNSKIIRESMQEELTEFPENKRGNSREDMIVTQKGERPLEN